LLVPISTSTFILYRFRDTITYAVFATASALQKSHCHSIWDTML